MGEYRTIVADPPWHYDDSWPGLSTSRKSIRKANIGTKPIYGIRKAIPYPTMTVDEIALLPVNDLADASGCHVYLWTTNRYMRSAYDVLAAWGARPGQILVWAKTPMGIGPGGDFAQNAEYVLTGRIGSLRPLQRVDSVWFNWPRTAVHSKKPEAFLDLVERVSPAPRLEMFARRNRLGWDTWGNEALEHVEIREA